MRNPAYLARSRHGIFYIRFALPRALHSEQKAATLKLSLGTRDPRLALRIANYLSHDAQCLVARGLANGMQYEDIREAVRLHFVHRLDTFRNQIATHGRLSADDVAMYRSGAALSQDAIENDIPLNTLNDMPFIQAFIEKYEFPISAGTKPYETLKQELRYAYRDYQKEVVSYDQSFNTYEFNHHAATSYSSVNSSAPRIIVSLHTLIQNFVADKKAGNQWALKTEGERIEHFALLTEIIGGDRDVSDIGVSDAHTFKDIIRRYPKNRNKISATKNLSLSELLVLQDLNVISVQTMNKYLHSYADLFKWAKSNRYVEHTLFDEMQIYQSKRQAEGDRQPYSMSQIRCMIDELVDTAGVVTKPHQKWGSLIGIYTGARLNEIAQLHLSDIRREGGIYYFDINAEDGKQLKNESSARRVPIHNDLLELDFLTYVDQVRCRGQVKLFPEFTYCPKNGWGRRLGSWFNNRFLVHMKMKTSQFVFHSLRHTVNTALLQASVQEPVVNKLLGRAVQGVTLGSYFKPGYTLRQLSDAMHELRYPEA